MRKRISSGAGIRAGHDVRSLVERLETRQMLSGVAASTAAGYLPAATILSRQTAQGGQSVLPSASPAVAKSAPATKSTGSNNRGGNNGGTTTTTTTTSSPGATPAASAPDYFPGSVWYGAGTGNYATGHAGHTVSWIVLHTTEETAASTITEFTTNNLQVSANYMVERDGVIDQFVADGNTAYHCGNLAYNESSIGIEHERYTSGGVQYNATEQEYEASATLVRWLSSYYGIPLMHLAASVAPADPSTGSDIIGHYQVPDPSNPSLGGGADHHTDPVNWDWNHYVDLLTTTTTPLMPVLIGVGSVTNGATSVTGTSQTLSWMPAANATSYKITVTDTTTNTTTTYTPTGTSQAITVVNGHTYSWSAVSLDGTTQSIASPTYFFTVGSATGITDAQKQSLMLGMVNKYRGTLLPEMVLATIMQEGGQGAFYDNGSLYNSFYSSSIQPWCQPTTNANGIMQVLSTSGYQAHAPYANTQQGYDDSINDGTTDLKAQYATYGTLWQASLHYDSGAASLYTYMGQNKGDKQFLSHIATKLALVNTIYGINDPALIDKYNAAQTILNSFLNNGSILSGQSQSYYASYQTQLDAQLKALGPADDAPAAPTNVSPAAGARNVSLTPTLTASAYSDPNANDAQSAAEWVIRRVSDGTIVYDSGADTTDKTSLTVPAGILTTGTLYSWYVSYADTEGTWSGSTATTFTTIDTPPTIAGLAITPNPVTQGFNVTATPSGTADSDGTVASVQYWAETNHTPGLQTGTGGDTLLSTVSTTGFVGTLSTANLPTGQQTFYAVDVDNLGASSAPASATVTIQLAATSLTATATGGRTMHLAWASGVTGISGFTLQRSSDGGATYTTVTQLPATATTYDDSGLTPATSYTYQLVAVSGGSSSTPVASNAAQTWTPGDADGDGKVTFNDFLILQNNYNQPGGWTQGDFDGNGIVDYNDFLVIQNAIG